MNIKNLLMLIFFIVLLIKTAFGFAGMSINETNITIDQPVVTEIKQIDVNNTTESDQDIIMVKHLIELDTVKLGSENKLFIRETLIFRNSGIKDFFGTLRTWIPDGSEDISLDRSEMMTGGGMVPIMFSRDGNIISWKDYVENNSPLPFLYVAEYTVKNKDEGTISSTQRYSKKLAFPALINYQYVGKPDLPALAVRMTKPESSTVKFIDENGNNIAVTAVDEQNEIFSFSSPAFKEINIDISESLLPLPKTQSNAVFIVIGILIVLILLWPFIKNKLKREKPSEDENTVSSGKFDGKNVKELGDIKIGIVTKINDLQKKYESGDLLDEEYEETIKLHKAELKEVETKLKKI